MFKRFRRMFHRRAQRQACFELLSQLFTYDEYEHCLDPVGSFDVGGVFAAVERIATGDVSPQVCRAAKELSKKCRTINNNASLMTKQRLRTDYSL